MTSVCYDNDIQKTQGNLNLESGHSITHIIMKLTTIIIDTVVIACFLTGISVTFDKIESASLSNPFTVKTAQLNQTN
ncbi:hypothetical protein [Crocosphaera sp.]|uniref:hypothetical protein n=1 Tax=Crocosphaera sp. TaxID=2729996 RepID=UPI0026147E6E|nr:hypothetical protein [Crocosphaera sp.]MDJ0581575.1 hypothetical protein [Crocosphaera sp.]